MGRHVTVQILFFAAYRELAGTPALALTLPEGSTVAGAVEALRARGGGLARLPEDPAVAVNRTYVPSSTLLRDGDEVALLPPVAGG